MYVEHYLALISMELFAALYRYTFVTSSKHVNKSRRYYVNILARITRVLYGIYVYSLYFFRCNISISHRADVYVRRININSLSQFRGADKACLSSSLRSSCQSINVYVTSMASATWNLSSYSH